VGTFHGIAHRLLRSHWLEAGLPQNFQVLDADDQLRLVRRVISSLELDEKKWPARQLTWFINSQKDEGLRAANIEDYGDLYLKTQLQIYRAYEEACDRGGMVDFAELLLRAHELWLKNPTLLRHYQERFRYLMVDEFQDTNTIQYAWLRLLAGDNDNLMVVGDDDQSIYGWRGAKIENIQRFSRDFANSRTIKLEQNYRSTGVILDAANGLISQNQGRLGKELWTDLGQGEPISLYAAYNEVDEARYIVEQIKKWDAAGNTRRECAILYRSNAQSRILEEAMLHSKIPYRIYGGQRFFERAEIRNALAYMRLLSHRDSDAAFERVINTPTRGIGDRTVDRIRSAARAKGSSMWQAAESLMIGDSLAGRAKSALHVFLQLINRMDEATASMDLGDLAEFVIEEAGLKAYHLKERGEAGQARVENLDELVNAARFYDPDVEVSFDMTSDEESPLSLLDEFLSHASLEAGDAQGDQFEDCVQMMTLHSAKGLEFPQVFIAGLEEGLFPHMMSMEEPGRMEEERRLCYVGVTRAMQHLHMSYAESRRMHGSETYNRPSRFIGEIPEDLLQEIRVHPSVNRPGVQLGRARPTGDVPDTDIRLGQRVMHSKFGEGVVLNYEGEGKQARVQVNFDRAGSKWLMVAYANLEAV